MPFTSVVELITGIISVIIIPIIFVHSYYHIRHVKPTTSKYFLASYFLSLSCYFLFDIMKLFTTIYTGRFDNQHFCEIYFQSYLAFAAGKCFMLTFLTFRVYVVFGKTIQNPFRRRNCIVINTLIVIFFVSIASGFTIHEIVQEWYNNYLQSGNNQSISSYDDCIAVESFNTDLAYYTLVIITFTGEIIFSVIVLRLYVRRLLGLATNIKDITDTNRIAVNGEAQPTATAIEVVQAITGQMYHLAAPECAFDEQSLEFLNAAAKATNLVIISIVSTIITSIIFDILGRWALTINTIVNSLSMYLTFSFGKRIYDIFCMNHMCSIHNCCFNICILKCFACCKWRCCECEC